MSQSQRSFKLTLQAQQSLTDIFVWTIDQFGTKQAELYKTQLMKRINALVIGEPPHGRSCYLLMQGLRESSDLEYYREGSHYIVYRNTTQQLLIVDFIHGSRNLTEILAELVD
ncbi:MAG: plasmid stabilization protein ParE [Gammaproteobacteria bacterium]|nr:MAG: plasmid stabilization protein ParE [Gammaproteobacteria bacterium]